MPFVRRQVLINGAPFISSTGTHPSGLLNRFYPVLWRSAWHLKLAESRVIEFLEVFIDGGFDIVLANPPYVRADAQFKHI